MNRAPELTRKEVYDLAGQFVYELLNQHEDDVLRRYIRALIGDRLSEHGKRRVIRAFFEIRAKYNRPKINL